MRKTKFFIGERVDYNYSPKSFWDADGFNPVLAAIYDASYVRYKTIEMISEEIKKSRVEGALAELGVYKGQTSYGLNWLFPDRKLYLFDTFEGFDSEQFDFDLKSGYLSKGMETHKTAFYDLSDTSAEMVLNNMPRKENCVIKKGFFPDSLGKEINEKFCLVSIDADLYQPIYDGLEYFYPRLNKGGYIIVHDYNHQLFEGVKKAVKDYEKHLGKGLCKFPVSDLCGSLVITK